MTKQFTRSTFAGHEGETFRVRAEGTPGPDAAPVTFDMILVEVGAPPGKNERPFSIMFHGSLDPFLRQGTYRFEHDALGAFELFIVPIGPDDGNRHMRYEAVFN